MKKPEETWDIIEKENVNLKQGFRRMPEAEHEIMEESEKNERMKK